jgi:hypothetical protein
VSVNRRVILSCSLLALAAPRSAPAQQAWDRQAVYVERETQLKKAILVDITRGTHTKDKLATYKAILDRWAGADTTPVVLKPRARGPKR